MPPLILMLKFGQKGARRTWMITVVKGVSETGEGGESNEMRPSLS